MAAERGFDDAIGVLAAAGAELDAQADRAKLSALHAAATMGHTKAVRVLIEAGAQIEVQTARLRTPLHIAAGTDGVDVL